MSALVSWTSTGRRHWAKIGTVFNVNTRNIYVFVFYRWSCAKSEVTSTIDFEHLPCSASREHVLRFNKLAPFPRQTFRPLATSFEGAFLRSGSSLPLLLRWALAPYYPYVSIKSIKMVVCMKEFAPPVRAESLRDVRERKHAVVFKRKKCVVPGARHGFASRDVRMCLVQLKAWRSEQNRTGLVLNPSLKSIFQRFFGGMAGLAEEQPFHVLEVILL